MGTDPHLTWNLAHDVSEVLEYHFMVNALLAGSVVAVMAGLLGWFMVLRRETFAGHTLSMMAFPGAAGAALIGVAATWGYFVFCVAGGLVIGRFSGGRGRSWSEQSAVIGSVQALALGLGFLFVSLYGGVLGDLDNLLFGTFLGISDSQVLVLVGVAVVAVVALVALGRPLAVRLDRRGRGEREGRAGAGAGDRVPGAARPDGGGDEPDDGRAARVRAALDAGGERPGGDGAAGAEPRADGR